MSQSAERGRKDTMTAAVVEFGMNNPITIKLPDRYFDILSLMAQLECKEIEELAKERLQQIIIEDITLTEEYWGQPLCRNWRESLKRDEYYKGVAVDDRDS